MRNHYVEYMEVNDIDYDVLTQVCDISAKRCI
jgi:hypothetical protein